MAPPSSIPITGGITTFGKGERMDWVPSAINRSKEGHCKDLRTNSSTQWDALRIGPPTSGHGNGQLQAGVHVFTDNNTCKSYLMKGYGKVPLLRETAQNIYRMCRERNILIRKVSYVPTLKNKEADNLSRMSEVEFERIRQECLRQTWRVSNEGFQVLNSKFGPFLVERFASVLDRHEQVPRFCSRGDVMTANWEHPITEAEWLPDAFIDEWVSLPGQPAMENYCVPPLPLLMRTVLHMAKTRSMGTIVVPKWISAPWWPILMCIGTQWMDVSDMIEHTESLKNPSTLKKYKYEWEKFETYCAFVDEPSLPANVDVLTEK